MKTYLVKLNVILPAFFAIALFAIQGLLLIRWFFTMYYPIIDIQEEYWEYWLPICCTILPSVIWLRPKLRILTFNDRERGSFFFQLLAWFPIAICAIFLQSYFTTVNGKLSTVDKVEDITKLEPTRYYIIKNFEVDKRAARAEVKVYTSGKQRQYLNFKIYFAIPLQPKGFDTALPTYWYALSFDHRIDNYVSDEEKQRRYETFLEVSHAKLNRYEFYDLDHFERLPTSQDKKMYLRAIIQNERQSDRGNYVILKPIKEAYADRNKNKPLWALNAFGIGFSIFLFALIWPKYNPEEHKRLRNKKGSNKNDYKLFLSYFSPHHPHFVTHMLLVANLAVFILMVGQGADIISPLTAELFSWGGNRRDAVLAGQWWRLISSLFVHGGIAHIVMNLGSLWVGGVFLEPVFGKAKFLTLYLLCGIAGGLLSLYWHPYSTIVGASGAIFGLVGTGISLSLFTKAFPKELRKTALVLLLVYATIGLLMGLVSDVDNAAHIGGLVAGLILGYVLYKK
ncbi:rhomboid family intramembrane serine protease [Olivibacter sp. SA151]|uniref:rhomboid family intramembrane serine protease n=1 Tax=Olivibacter jilunii TaxID=985016 RepID=UPI003F13A5A5